MTSKDVTYNRKTWFIPDNKHSCGQLPDQEEYIVSSNYKKNMYTIDIVIAIILLCVLTFL